MWSGAVDGSEAEEERERERATVRSVNLPPNNQHASADRRLTNPNSARSSVVKKRDKLTCGSCV
jgi:hypothetical protein